MTNFKVSIVILNWNGLDDTVHCLESLEKITYPNYDIVVVDNGSKGDDAEILREKFKGYIHIIENDKNYGFAEGCNIGMRYALKNSHPDYILLLNNDTVVGPDFLSELVKIAERNPSIGITGPKIYFYDEPNRLQSAGAVIDWCQGKTPLIGPGEIDKGQFEEIKDVDWVIGCALLIKRRALEEIGLLYPKYFAFFEETEWCVRCKKAGFRIIYVPRAKLWHKSQRTTGKPEGFLLYYTTRNRFLFMRRNSTRLQLFFFLIYFFLRDFWPTSALLLIKERNLKLFINFLRGVGNGIILVIID